MPTNDDRETVASILLRKVASIKQAPLPVGSPSWDDILEETWRDIKRKAKRKRTGDRVFRKLLTDTRFDKE
jgi:hypothetical protein